jgi:hypothetical protein
VGARLSGRGANRHVHGDRAVGGGESGLGGRDQGLGVEAVALGGGSRRSFPAILAAANGGWRKSPTGCREKGTA